MSPSTRTAIVTDTNLTIKPVLPIPVFDCTNTSFSFAKLELYFNSVNIFKDETKYSFLLNTLPAYFFPHVVEGITKSESENNKYQALKAALVKVATPTEDQKFNKLINSDMGELSPRQFINKLRLIAPKGDNEGLIKHTFLKALPNNIKLIVSSHNFVNLDELVEAAQRIHENENNKTENFVAQIINKPSDTSEVTTLRNTILRLEATINKLNHKRKPFNNSNSEICFYHTKYGENAHKCTAPCKFKSSLN